MHKHHIIRIGFIALALVLGAATLRSSGLEASGYIIAMGRYGEVVCEPGGTSDCGNGNET